MPHEESTFKWSSASALALFVCNANKLDFQYRCKLQLHSTLDWLNCIKTLILDMPQCVCVFMYILICARIYRGGALMRFACDTVRPHERERRCKMPDEQWKMTAAEWTIPIISPTMIINNITQNTIEKLCPRNCVRSVRESRYRVERK